MSKRAWILLAVLVGLVLVIMQLAKQLESEGSEKAETPQAEPPQQGAAASKQTSKPASPSEGEWTPIQCDLGGELSYMAELRGPGLQAQISVLEGTINLPFAMTHGIATGPEGAWEIQVMDGQCEARVLQGQASILGEVLSAVGEPVQGVSVTAECELGLQDGPRTVATRSSWDGSFALDIPTDTEREQVTCQLHLQRGMNQGAEVVKGPTVNAAEQPYLTLLAPSLTLPLSADPELACEESAAFRAVFELRDTGALNDVELAIEELTAALPDCGVAELSEQQNQAWRDWFNAKGPRP